MEVNTYTTLFQLEKNSSIEDTYTLAYSDSEQGTKLSYDKISFSIASRFVVKVQKVGGGAKLVRKTFVTISL